MTDELTVRHDLALRLAIEAGRRVDAAYRPVRRSAERKTDGTVVTETDRATEAWIREQLAAALPDDGVVGEEHGVREGSTGYRWILDPIDGTASFVHGVPLFGTLVAVEFEERPVIGVIHIPGQSETVHAATGRGAWHRVGGRADVPAIVSTVDQLDRAMFCTTSRDSFSEAGCPERYAALCDASAGSRGWSDCYCLLLLATGRVDVVVEPIMHIWDIAPAMPILAEAGGRCTDWAGRPDASALSQVATNGHLHEQVLALLT